MVNRPEPLAEWPIEKPVTNAGKRAAELHATWAGYLDRVAAVERDYAAAQEALKVANEELRAVLFDAQETGKSGKVVTDAEAAFTKAEQEANAPWQQRLEAPVRAAESARDAYTQHISDHLDEVLSEPELADGAVAAREGVEKTTKAQVEACAEWRRVAHAHSAIIKVADGITGQSVPHLDGPAKDACAAGERLLGRSAPTPCVSQRDLDDRRVRRGEAEVVEVDGPNGKGIQVVNK